MFLDAHAPDIPPRYSRAEIAHMIRDAKTSDDFERLADYFDFQALDFQRKAQDDLKGLEQLAASRFRPKTYPAQFANALQQMQQDKAKAQECSDRAYGYRTLKAAAGGTE
jgi:hypothetical protein